MSEGVRCQGFQKNCNALLLFFYFKRFYPQILEHNHATIETNFTLYCSVPLTNKKQENEINIYGSHWLCITLKYISVLLQKEQ